MTSSSTDGVRRVSFGSVRQHWVWFLIEGVVLVLLGIAAIALPLVASIASAIFLGWLLIIAGVVGLFTTLRSRTVPGFLWSIVSAILALVAGGVLAFQPLVGIVSLTLVLAAFFAAEGIVTIVFALTHRQAGSGGWAWMIFSGIVDLVLSGLIISAFPGSAAWAVGLLVGINLLIGGGALIGMALSARTMARTEIESARPAAHQSR